MTLIGALGSRLYGTDDQLRYLSQSVLMEEAAMPRVVRFTTLVICAAVIVFLIWASFAQVSEVATAKGEVVPHGYVRVVQHLEGGILSEIRIREGDLVQKRDILARLDGAGTYEDLQELKAKQLSLEMQAERLRAFVDDRPPAFDAAYEDQSRVIAEQQKIYDGMLAARDSEMRVIEAQIGQKREELTILEARADTVEQNIRLGREIRDMHKDLLTKGVSSRLAFLERQEELNRLQGELRELTAEANLSRQQISEFENRLTSLAANSRNDAYQQLDRLDSEIAQNHEALAKLRNRVDRLELRSPVEGLVKGIRVTTVGAVISPGQTLMEIVPINESLVAEIRISPNDIGHVKVGQPVHVKIGSYDFARYGSVDGVLEFVSATTFADEAGGTYYLGRVVLDQNYVGEVAGRNLVLPGMGVEADIVTGGKSILAYLLKPIHVSLSTAMTER